MGASHSADYTVATAKVNDIRFALVPCGLFADPLDDGFRSLFGSYDPRPQSQPPLSGTTSAGSTPNSSTRGSVTAAQSAAHSRVLAFYCATFARRSIEEYYDKIAAAPNRVDPSICTPMPVAVAVCDANGWRFCGYLGARAFNSDGSMDPKGGVLGIFLDHTSHRSWSLVAFRLACRMYVDCCKRAFGKVQWPEALRWTVLKHNVYCLRATLNAARYIDMLDRDRLREQCEGADGASTSASAGSSPMNASGHRTRPPPTGAFPTHVAAEAHATRSTSEPTVPRGVPRPEVMKGPVSVFAKAFDPLHHKLLLDRPKILQVADLSEEGPHGEAFEQIAFNMDDPEGLAEAAMLMAESVAPMEQRYDLPEGLAQLLPKWARGKDMCLEAEQMQFDPGKVETLQEKERAKWGGVTEVVATIERATQGAQAAKKHFDACEAKRLAHE